MFLEEPIVVDKKLAPNEKCEVSVTLKVPADTTDNFIEGKFRLFDPIAEKKFGQEMQALVLVNFDEDDGSEVESVESYESEDD